MFRYRPFASIALLLILVMMQVADAQSWRAEEKPSITAPYPIWNATNQNHAGHVEDVAFNGSAYLALLWRTGGEPNGPSPPKVTWDGCHIFGIMLSSRGKPLKTEPFPINTSYRGQVYTQTASNGKDFLVVWMDNQIENTTTNWNIRGTFVNGDGTVVNPAGFDICTAPHNQYWPQVAGDTNGFFVAWMDERESPVAEEFPGDGVPSVNKSSRIYGRHISNEGILGPERMVSANDLVATDQDSGTPSVGSNGQEYLVAWHGGYLNSIIIQAKRFDTFGQSQDSKPLVLAEFASPENAGSPTNNVTDGDRRISLWWTKTKSNGQDFLVAWSGRLPQNYLVDSDLMCCRVTREGAVLDFNGVVVESSPRREERVSVASNGQDYLLSYQGQPNGLLGWEGPIYGARVSAEAEILDRPSFLVVTNNSGNGRPNLIYSGGDSFLLIYSHDYYYTKAKYIQVSRKLPEIQSLLRNANADKITVRWTSNPLKNYAVQYRKAIKPEMPWEEVTGVIEGGAQVTETTVRVNPVNRTGFFRVREMDP